MNDYHMHTLFSDGKNDIETMVQKGIELGMKEIGISEHSYTFFDEESSIQNDKYEEYYSCIQNLKEKYKGKIKIFCGIEQDYYSPDSGLNYDYIIGSVHYILCNEEYVSIDLDIDTLKRARDQYFGGDIYSLIETYYTNVENVVDKTKANIVGHFDLITKFQEREVLFDVRHPRYIAAWKKAADKLLNQNVAFELNVGPIIRGYKKKPFPCDEIYSYLKERGAKFLYSSDSHRSETIGQLYDEVKEKCDILYIKEALT